jgi:general secretion pathway protein E
MVMARLDIAETPAADGLSACASPDVRSTRVDDSAGWRASRAAPADKQAGKLDLQQLGMAPRRCGGWPKRSSGRTASLLVTGPTGSGKTTTSNSVAAAFERSQQHHTVEDLIE